MMKRTILLVALVALCAYPSSKCLASYLVQLTNGNRFITYAYWEDGSQIRFYSGGGAVAVAKASVRQIRETDRPVTVQTDRKPIILSQNAPHGVPEEDGSTKKTSEGMKKASAPATLDDYREKKRLLQAKLDKPSVFSHNHQCSSRPCVSFSLSAMARAVCWTKRSKSLPSRGLSALGKTSSPLGRTSRGAFCRDSLGMISNAGGNRSSKYIC